MPVKKKKPVDVVKMTPSEEKMLEFAEEKEFRYNASQDRSNTKTPDAKVKQKAGFDYVTEGYLRNQLSKHFPTWSWIPAGNNPVQFLGSEWIIVTGNLVVDDHGVKRTFMSPGSARVMFKSGAPHTAENVIDIDKNVAAANTNGFKRAVNRLCNIADDVYRKIESEWMTEEQEAVYDAILEEMLQAGLPHTVYTKFKKKKEQVTPLNFNEYYGKMEEYLNKLKTKETA
jgi:hypothetical protein